MQREMDACDHGELAVRGWPHRLGLVSGSFWKGPLPNRDTIFEVAITSLGEYRRYRVKASSFLRAAEKPG